jgi:PhoPQ-activated pathogenicity-related protein
MRIRIWNRDYEVEAHSLSRAQIVALADVPYDRIIYLDGRSMPLRDDEVVEISDGMIFHAIPQARY